ncbi:hypothetical protein [Pandoraea sp. ISTKB]|uniref:hypothetical protein n=1 Tax=Pandoraea sp. ISTKB TaxID=1586708 RepID=UPI0008464763|nr:hypothetical protein [Pandoraea sp. ISTKB]ODP34172.1 hypothetical protein A9762_03680 [Pandoraea sp. ISTKB]
MLFNDTAPTLPKPAGPPPWFEKLADDATLEAAVLKRPVHGRENIIALIKVAIGVYEGGMDFRYLRQMDDLFLESYRSTVAGQPIENMVVVHYNAEGLADSVVINHRPLGAALTFSRLMWEKVGDRFGDLYLTGREADAMADAAASGK